jgi:transposase InsO family protein
LTKKITTASGYLLAAKFEKEKKTEVACAALMSMNKISANELHKKMGHVNEQYMRTTAESMGLEVTVTMEKCEACAIGKSKQKSVPKQTDNKATAPGELIYMDIARIKNPSQGSKKYWILFVDAYSGCAVSRFVKQKDESVEVGVQFFNDLSQEGIQIKTIRCDNAGENKKLESQCKKIGITIKFEYTAPGTPQQNGVVERKFATLFGRVRAMNTGAGLSIRLRNQMWAEAASTATDIDALVVKKINDKTPYELFNGKTPPYAAHLRTFGEIGVIRNIFKRTSKSWTTEDQRVYFLAMQNNIPAMFIES